MQPKYQRSKRNDGQHSKRAVDPHQLAVEGGKFLQVFAPMQTRRHLKAGYQDADMSDPRNPKRQTENVFRNQNDLVL